MTIHPDLVMLYVTGSVLVTTSAVYLLHALGSWIGRTVVAQRERRTMS
jgi:hypothetical protein